jgi:hypothetical protein
MHIVFLSSPPQVDDHPHLPLDDEARDRFFNHSIEFKSIFPPCHALSEVVKLHRVVPKDAT